jgi:hypothetical protein
MRYALAIAFSMIVSPALASTDDMSSSEFFNRERTGNWKQAADPFTETNRSVKTIVPANRQSVADMVADETAKKIGSAWVGTALRLAKIESNFNCGAVGPKTRHGRARGVLQVMPGSARALGYDPRRLNECRYGIAAGVAHMQMCIAYGVKSHKQMASCHVSGPHGWKTRLNRRAENYRNQYVRMVMR